MPDPTPTTPAALRFDGVSKHFGKAEVLRGVSFDVPAGRAFGLAGVNGAGKTTLIKCMLDLAAVDAGAIEIFGASHRHPAARTRLAFLPERFVPPWYLTGRDFLRFMLDLDGRPYVEDEVQALLAALDLDPSALSRPARSFSKGMTQKLGLAACFLARRDLYILDEPMSGLDPKARAHLKDLLAAERARGRHPLLHVPCACRHRVGLRRNDRPASRCAVFLRCAEGPVRPLRRKHAGARFPALH